MEKKEKYPVCGNYTLTQRHVFDICPVCFWEDDCFIDDENEYSSANVMTLAEARENWQRDGSCSSHDASFCRKPFPSELPWIYEHEVEVTGDDDRDAMVDVMRDLYFISSEVHSHEKEYYEAANSVYNECLSASEGDMEPSDDLPTETDKEEMIRIFELLADHGDYAIESNIKLAECYLKGFGVAQNTQKTAEFLREAAEYIEIENKEGVGNGEI